MQNFFKNKNHIILLKKGTFAILDQGTNSGTNFLISILLGRWLIPDDYGAYALVFSIFLFLSGFQNSLVLEPFSVFGSSKFQNSFREYTGLLIRWQLIISLILSFFIIIIVLIFKNNLSIVLQNNLLGLSVALPFLFLAWFVRRVYYVLSNSEGALLNSFLQASFTLVGLICILYMFNLSGMYAFIIFGFGALFSTGFAIYWIRPILLFKQRDINYEKEIQLTHWNYGKWVILTNFVFWISSNGYMWGTGLFLNFSDIAGLRAMQNLISPTSMISIPLTTLILPWSVKKYNLHKISWLNGSVPLLTIMFMVISTVLLIPVLFYSSKLEIILYKGNYSTYIWLLPYIIIAQVIASAISGIGIGLRTIEAPQKIFYGYSASALATIIFGIPAMYYWGLLGVAYGVILNPVILLLVLIYQWKKELRAKQLIMP